MTGITKLPSLQYNSYIPTLPDVRLLLALSLRKTSVDAKGCSELDLPSFAPNRPQRTQRIDAMRYDTIFLRTTHISLFRFALQHHPSTPHRFAAFMATRRDTRGSVRSMPCRAMSRHAPGAPNRFKFGARFCRFEDSRFNHSGGMIRNTHRQSALEPASSAFVSCSAQT